MTPNVTGTRRASVDHDCCTLLRVASTVARNSDRDDKMIVVESISVANVAVEMAVKGEFGIVSKFKIASLATRVSAAPG